MIPIVDNNGIAGIELAPLMGILLQFLFSTLRIGSFLIASPLFGARYIPLPVRIIGSVSLAVAIFPLAAMPSVETLSQLTAVSLVLQELIIGLSAGLVLTILFGAAATAGDRIANAAGLGFASQIDPSSGSQSPVIAQVLSLMLLVTFLAEDGHLTAIRIILESYLYVPPGTPSNLLVLLDIGVRTAGEMFFFAVQLMLPVVGILLLVNVVIGVLTRSAPQLNIFSFGFPLTLMVSLVLLYLTAPSLVASIAYMVRYFLDILLGLVTGLSNG